MSYNVLGLAVAGKIEFRQPVPQPNRITKVESKNKKLIKELSARTNADGSTNADDYSFSPANAKPHVASSFVSSEANYFGF